MIEVKGDLWDVRRWKRMGSGQKPWLIVPTNRETRSNGEAVMGAGVAAQAARFLPNLPSELGRKLKTSGNRVYRFENLILPRHAAEDELHFDLVTFPTKNHWKNDSDLDLIRTSAVQLREESRATSGLVVLPKVGSGCGNLPWPSVKAVLSEELPTERFVVVGW